MILELLVSLLAVFGFGLALSWSRIVPVARDALKVTMQGLSSMTDSELDDDAKEVAVRRAGFQLIFASFNISWRFAVALAAAAVPIYLGDGLGFVSSHAVFGLMLRWDYIIVVSIVAMGLTEVLRRRRPAGDEETTHVNRYSAADRMIHVMAFSSPVVLKTASALEDRLCSKPTQQPSGPPIFITSLARGGTTALLNALHDVTGIATHTYRDMPFLTAPILWNRVSGGHKRSVDRHERAHGDGLEIDLDTPEAFEEIIWKMFWPEHYRKASIPLWRPEHRKAHAERFLERHMAKIIHARTSKDKDGEADSTRYCSKNNANVARIPYLREAFPDCDIIVPVRRPECHAASLLRQHRNFLKLHAEDEFIERYMRDIGHFEFGNLHKPFQFPGFSTDIYHPTTGNYWLNYWIHAFRKILADSDRCIFVLQDDLRSSPQATMTGLCGALNVDGDSLAFHGYFRSSADRSPTDAYEQRLYEEAATLYRQLEERALRSARQAASVS
ncbi:MAG: sulfotransferase [Myxococcota bacterium]